MAGLMLLAISALASPNESPIDALIACYADKTTALRQSTEPAATVADAVMALCQAQEIEANNALHDIAVSGVQERTGGSRADAERAAGAIRDEGWRRWKANMRSQIIAAIVQSRAQQSR